MMMWTSAAEVLACVCVCVCDRPGLYDCRLPATRKVTYQQSFGGRPINLPDVTQHSTIDANTDKVDTHVSSFSLIAVCYRSVNAICK